MAKFNAAPEGLRTENLEGHAAYRMSDKDRLVAQALTAFFGEPKFYGDNAGEIVATAADLASREPEFIARLAVFARREFHIRSVPHALAAILAHEPKGKELARRLIDAVVARADDMTEILSAYLAMFGKPVPNSLKKGISDAMRRFDEYALAKYKAEGRAFKMRDAIRICHPRPKDGDQAAMWKRCLAGELATPATWEAELSAGGNTKETWEKLIDGGGVGYMALLRNLRSIVAAAPDNIGRVYEALADRERVLRSRQLPFRFMAAYKELRLAHGENGAVPSKALEALGALEAAAGHSVGNVARIPGRTAIAVDVSGSMRSPVSARSKMTCAELALLLGVLAARVCEDSLFFTFDTELYAPAVSSQGGILAQAEALAVCGGGTDISLPFRHLLEQRISVDRVIVLSDCEINSGDGRTVQGHADAYRRGVNADAWVHAIDLQGYGTQQFLGPRTNIVAGWSERALEFISLAEAGLDRLTQRVEAYRY
jgi:hypothetical protein